MRHPFRERDARASGSRAPKPNVKSTHAASTALEIPTGDSRYRRSLCGCAGRTDFDLPVLGERGSENVLGLRLGLDLAGGTQLIYQAGDEEFQPSDEQMEGFGRYHHAPVDRLGVAEPSIQRLGDDRLLIQLPGVEDVEQAKRTIGQTAQLEIIERICLDSSCVNYEDQPTGLTGADMARAFASQDVATNEPILSFRLDGGAAQQFAVITQRINASGNQLAFVLDGETLVSATVRTAILAGVGQIDGNFTLEDVRQLAIQVESGRLPIDITEISASVVAGSLGAKSLDDALIAGGVGLLLVLFFMVAYYRTSGLVAGVALSFYIIIVLAIFKLAPVTLTLAGLAGFILSLGMAVDANILIFERVKEELRLGRTVQFAMQTGLQPGMAVDQRRQRLDGPSSRSCSSSSAAARPTPPLRDSRCRSSSA